MDFIEYFTYPRTKYEGEYINGKKCGKGKEYIHNYNREFLDDLKNYTLIFEGEFFNDCRINGKEYYENGKLKYEGEFLFKEKLNGKIYDYNGNMLFEINNANGLVEDYYKDKIKIFVGENLNEKKLEGIVKGKEYDFNGRLLFEGEYKKKQRWKGKFKEYQKDELVF